MWITYWGRKISYKTLQMITQISNKLHNKLCQSQNALVFKDDKCIRIYQLWEGNNKFRWNGYFIKGPSKDAKAKYCYLIVFWIIQLLYFLIIAPFIFLKVSIILFAFTIWMLILTVVFSILTSIKDPGIIPRYPILKAINNGILPEKCAKPELDDDAFIFKIINNFFVKIKLLII